MHSLFLLGGGGSPDGLAETYGRFVDAATTPEGCRIALVIAEESGTFAIGTSGPASADSSLYLWWPHADYQESLCVDRAWLDYLAERSLVFGGVSAPDDLDNSCSSDRPWISTPQEPVPATDEGCTAALRLSQRRGREVDPESLAPDRHRTILADIDIGG